MKIEKLLLFIFCVLSSFIDITAQTYYYNDTKTFYESGYTYQCDVTNGAVTLYNKDNQYTYIKQTYKNGSPLGPEYWNGSKVYLLENETWTKPLCHSIVNNAFSSTEKSRVKGEKLLITMYVNPDNGIVSEVNFWFSTNRPFATIPLSVYRSIEINLQDQIWFTPTTQGRNLNYIMRFWMHEVK